MKHKTNWDKKLDNPNTYSSNWDWTVAHSEYHFNNSIEDNIFYPKHAIRESGYKLIIVDKR